MDRKNSTFEIFYQVNRRMKRAWIACDFEGNFALDGSAFHRSQLKTIEIDTEGNTMPFLTEFDYWHADEPNGQCDTRGCPCNGGGE